MYATDKKLNPELAQTYSYPLLRINHMCPNFKVYLYYYRPAQLHCISLLSLNRKSHNIIVAFLFFLFFFSVFFLYNLHICVTMQIVYIKHYRININLCRLSIQYIKVYKMTKYSSYVVRILLSNVISCCFLYCY